VSAQVLEVSDAGTLTFESYLAMMKPWVDRTVARQVKNGRYHEGPYHDRDDLRAEATRELWLTYRRLAGKKPLEELCRIGTNAVVKQMYDTHQRLGKGGFRGYTSPEGTFVKPSVASLDATDYDFLADGIPPIDRSLALRQAVERGLDAQEESVPGSRRVFEESLDGAKLHEVAKRTGMRPGDVRAIFQKLRTMIQKELGCLPSQEDEAMMTTGNGPEAPDSEGATTAATTEKPAAKKRVRKPAAGKKPAAKTTGGGKKKAAAKKPKVAKVAGEKKRSNSRDGDPAGKFKVGQEVLYDGGGRAAWLNKGVTLVVKGVATESTKDRVYLRVLCPSKDKRTVVAEAHVKAK
jgi:DNA-directed RNA polymerase specialized sigma24 family protein